MLKGAGICAYICPKSGPDVAKYSSTVGIWASEHKYRYAKYGGNRVGSVGMAWDTMGFMSARQGKTLVWEVDIAFVDHFSC